MSAIFPDELVKIWKGKALSALRQVFDMVVVVLGNSPQKEEGRPQNRHCRWQETSVFSQEIGSQQHFWHWRGKAVAILTDECLLQLKTVLVDRTCVWVVFLFFSFFSWRLLCLVRPLVFAGRALLLWSLTFLMTVMQVNMFTTQGTVIHFNNPKVQASLAANTFTITGHAETKQLTEMLPSILNQLGADSLTSLRKLAENLPKQGVCVCVPSWLS